MTYIYGIGKQTSPEAQGEVMRNSNARLITAEEPDFSADKNMTREEVEASFSPEYRAELAASKAAFEAQAAIWFGNSK